ncbi:MAG TPA: DUF3276 family protein [Ignavibacteriaceae bacterium]
MPEQIGMQRQLRAGGKNFTFDLKRNDKGVAYLTIHERGKREGVDYSQRTFIFEEQMPDFYGVLTRMMDDLKKNQAERAKTQEESFEKKESKVNVSSLDEDEEIQF